MSSWAQFGKQGKAREAEMLAGEIQGRSMMVYEQDRKKCPWVREQCTEMWVASLHGVWALVSLYRRAYVMPAIRVDCNARLKIDSIIQAAIQSRARVKIDLMWNHIGEPIGTEPVNVCLSCQESTTIVTCSVPAQLRGGHKCHWPKRKQTRLSRAVASSTHRIQ